MKQLFLFLLFSLPSLAYCDEEKEIYLFNQNDVVYLIGDSVKLRSEASTSSSVVKQLAIGTKLTVLKKTEIQQSINGFWMSWYEVQVDKKTTGFVWGGKLAINSSRSNKNTDFIFHFGIEKVVNDEVVFQIRVEKNKKELQHLTFKGFGSPFKQFKFTHFANRGLTNVDDVLYVDGFAEACGETAGAIVFFWSNSKLIEVKRLDDFFDAPVFSSQRFIFPADMDGTKDKILFEEQIGEHIFPEDNPDITEQTIIYEKNQKTAFLWNGKALVKSK